MSSFFSSGLAMWSPALSDGGNCSVRPITTTATTAAVPTAPATVFPYFQYHHEPVYDPPTCAVCGLPHRSRHLDLEVLNDQSTLSSASSFDFDSEDREFADEKNHLSIIARGRRRSRLGCFECTRLVMRCIHAFWRRVFSKRKAVYPSRMRRSKAP